MRGNQVCERESASEASDACKEQPLAFALSKVLVPATPATYHPDLSGGGAKMAEFCAPWTSAKHARRLSPGRCRMNVKSLIDGQSDIQARIVEGYNDFQLGRVEPGFAQEPDHTLG